MSTQTPSSGRSVVSIASLEREMVIAGIVWVIVGALCVVAANAWAAGV